MVIWKRWSKIEEGLRSHQHPGRGEMQRIIMTIMKVGVVLMSDLFSILKMKLTKNTNDNDMAPQQRGMGRSRLPEAIINI